MTGTTSSTQDKNLRIAITGSLVLHGLLFLLLAWMFAGDAAHRLWKQSAAAPKEKEVMLLFPDQILLPPKEEKDKEAEKEKAKKKDEEPKKKEIPPPPPLKPDQYLRTTQNQTATEAPKRPAYISDRNTTAATKKAPSPDASPAETLPSMDGMKTVALELVDREYRGGEVREDTAPPSPGLPAKPNTMTTPLPVAPPTILKPKDNSQSPREEQPKKQEARPAAQMAQAPTPESKPQQQPPQAMPPPPAPAPDQPQPPTEPTDKPAEPAAQKVALAKPVTSPLSRLLDEADKELAREDKNRLSIELKKAEAVTPQNGLPQPQPQMQPQAKVDTPPPTPQAPAPPTPAREVAQTPPESPMKPSPKSLPMMSEPLDRPPPGMQDPNAYVPYTRTTRTKSTISTKGDVPSVDAIESPKGRYTRQVEGQIGKLWHRYSSFRRDTGPGRLEISFYVTKKGKVESVVIQDDKKSNVVLTEFSLRAVRDAEIPPMPADVYPELPEFDPNRLRFDFSFTVSPP